ncbi:MAG TPA: FkbM family methyltransferase, partial [Bacteroidales bacterium]|nr:FkbM family methyltransferase [Bacteroidales bacterium]
KNQSNEYLAKEFQQNLYKTFLPDILETVISSAFAIKGKLVGVQVGANDGLFLDPVFELFHKYFDKIILVEPLKELIPKLQKNYSNFKGELFIENVAISNEVDNLTLYKPNAVLENIFIEKVFHRDTTIFTSFNKNHVVDHITRRLGLDSDFVSSNIDSFPVPACTVELLLKKHNIENVDFVQIDCEGYDFEVIKSLGKQRPALINFEWKWFSQEVWSDWIKWANDNNYGFIQQRLDCMAIRHSNYNILF